MTNGNVDVKVTKEGIIIPANVLLDLHITEEVEVMKMEDFIIIKLRSLTDSVRGIVKDSKLSSKELDDAWFEGKK